MPEQTQNAHLMRHGMEMPFGYHYERRPDLARDDRLTPMEGLQFMQQPQEMPQQTHEEVTPYEDSSTPYGSFADFLPIAYQLFMGLFHKDPGQPHDSVLGKYINRSIGPHIGEQR